MDRFLCAVRAGVPYVHAATAAGVSDRSVQRWLNDGEDAQDAVDEGEVLDEQAEACRLFWQEVTVARAQVAVEHMSLIQQAARGGQLLRRRTLTNGTVEDDYAPIDWRAASKLLDLSFRRDFEQARQLEVTNLGTAASMPVSETVQVLAKSLRKALDRDPADDWLPEE